MTASGLPAARISTWRFMGVEAGAAAVGGLGAHLQAVAARARRTPSQPAAAVGVDLVEDGDALAADADEVVDQAGGLLA